MRWRMILLLAFCTSCFQTTSDDDNLRIVPVTNNPHIVPNHGGIAGMPVGGPN